MNIHQSGQACAESTNLGEGVVQCLCEDQRKVALLHLSMFGTVMVLACFWCLVVPQLDVVVAELRSVRLLGQTSHPREWASQVFQPSCQVLKSHAGFKLAFNIPFVL